MKVHALAAALLAGQVLAASIPPSLQRQHSPTTIARSQIDHVSNVHKRQNKVGYLQWIKDSVNHVFPASLLWSGMTGKLESFLGEPEATEAITLLARILGATRDRPGYMLLFASHSNGRYGIVPAPEDSAPRVKVLEPAVDIDGSRRIKIRYGPYLVPNSSRKNGIGAQGMLSSYPHIDMQRPCNGNCTILGATAGLEFLNGTNANVDNGMWLHHLTVMSIGQGREDITCSDHDISVPHVSLGTTPRSSERIFASGNERTPLSFIQHGAKDIGYKLFAADKLGSQIELWNDNPTDMMVWITITWDYVEGHPFKDDVKVIWLDARQCGTSEVNPPADREKFRLDYTWNSTLDAEILGIGGHLHDGGSSIELTVDGQDACTSQTRYGTNSAFIGRANPGGHDHGETVGMKHISEQSPCYGDSLRVKSMKRGQAWKLEGYYDLDEFGANKHADGSLDEVMAIALVYVRIRR